jgi:serine/threonine protein kinase
MSGTEVAVKVITDSGTDEFYKEAEMLCALKSPYIVEFFGVAILEGPLLSMVMEFCAGGTLAEVLQERGASVGSAGLVQTCLHIAYGLHHIHSMNVVHRDIACRNVLVTTTGVCKLADMGLARFLDADVYFATSAVATRWAPPETLQDSSTTLASDIYSLGITFQEAFAFGKMPFSETCRTNAQVIKAVLSGQRPPCPSGTPPSVWNIIQTLWVPDPSARPEIAAVCAHLEAALEEVAATPGGGVNEMRQSYYNFG